MKRKKARGAANISVYRCHQDWMPHPCGNEAGYLAAHKTEDDHHPIHQILNLFFCLALKMHMQPDNPQPPTSRGSISCTLSPTNHRRRHRCGGYLVARSKFAVQKLGCWEEDMRALQGGGNVR